MNFKQVQEHNSMLADIEAIKKALDELKTEKPKRRTRKAKPALEGDDS